jgi:sec-independent protein translocase protein TatA
MCASASATAPRCAAPAAPRRAAPPAAAPSSRAALVGACLAARAPRRAGRPAPAARRVAVAGLFGLGVPEIAVIAGVVALIYGPSKLPEIGKGLGKTMKSFQSAAKEFEKELKEEMTDDAPAEKK